MVVVVVVEGSGLRLVPPVGKVMGRVFEKD